MKFGIAYEGATDYITIKNILRGCFPNLHPKKQIHSLQPSLDETDGKQLNFGGWEELFAYLESVYFYDALENSVDYVIIQIDTDESQHVNFNISHCDENNEELEVEQLIENVKNKLISIINKKNNLYEDYAEKIIFAISVHSLECWFYAFYDKKQRNKPKIKGCFDALRRLPNLPKCENSKTVEKNYDCYNILSQPFLKLKNIDVVSQKDPSFRIFIQAFENIQV
jgi:hypothetical protein